MLIVHILEVLGLELLVELIAGPAGDLKDGGLTILRINDRSHEDQSLPRDDYITTLQIRQDHINRDAVQAGTHCRQD